MKKEPASEYLSANELKAFKKARDSGEITVFRARLCEGIFWLDDDPIRACKNEIPISNVDGVKLRFCSKECFENIEGVNDVEESEW